MKKTVLLVVAVLFINGVVPAQTQTGNTKKPLCEDCDRFPYKPYGCDHTNCLEQLLSAITRRELISYFSLPANISDKIIDIRNGGAKGIQDYRAALEPYEYTALLNGYDHYVAQRTPAR